MQIIEWFKNRLESALSPEGWDKFASKLSECAADIFIWNYGSACAEPSFWLYHSGTEIEK